MRVLYVKENDLVATLAIVFILLFSAAELIFRLRMRFGVVTASSIVLIVVTLLGAFGYFFEESAYGVERPPIKYSLSYIIMFGSPLLIILVTASLFKKSSSLFIHWFAGIFSAIYTGFFPLIAIYTVCSLGIDCM